MAESLVVVDTEGTIKMANQATYRLLNYEAGTLAGLPLDRILARVGLLDGTALAGGYEWARWEHFWLTMGYVGFFVIHITQVVRAGWNNFRAMVIGAEVTSEQELLHEPVGR